MNERVLAWIGVFGALGIVGASAQIRNGSFEWPRSDGMLFGQTPDYWTSSSSGWFPKIINTTEINWSHYLPASDGDQLVQLYGNSISQNISLAAGQAYRLTFDLSPRQPDGSAPQDALLDVSISNGRELSSASFFVPFGTAVWVQEQFTFDADAGGSYALTLASPPLQIYTSMIDNVRLEAVPEPRMMTLMAVGGVVVLIFRRKEWCNASKLRRFCTKGASVGETLKGHL